MFYTGKKIVSCYSNTLASGATWNRLTLIYKFTTSLLKTQNFRHFENILEWIFPEGINFFFWKTNKSQVCFSFVPRTKSWLDLIGFFQVIRVESIPCHCYRSAPIRKKAVVVNKIRLDRQNRIRVLLMTGSNDKCFSWLRKSNYMDIFQAIVWYNFMREK